MSKPAYIDTSWLPWICVTGARYRCRSKEWKRNFKMCHLLRPASFSSAGALLYLNEELSDVTVIVKDDAHQWQFPAHGLVLSAESSVFRSMLEEKSMEDNPKQLLITNLTPSTTEHLLRYMYCGNLEVENWTEGLDLLQAAFNYKVDKLIQKCGKFLENVICLSNVCHVYNKASACSLPVLQDKCLKLILDAGFIVLRSRAFDTLHKDCVMHVLASSDLNIDQELVVFETLYRWARLECCRTGQAVTEANVLSEMKPFLQHVCVDDMSDADKSALPPSLLSCVKPNNKYRIVFSVPQSLLLYSMRLEFEMNENCLDFIGDNLSCLRFSVDSPVHLIGLCLTIVPDNIPLHLNLILGRDNFPRATLFNLDIASIQWIQSLRINQRTWQDGQIILNKPVTLRPGDVYNIFLKDTDSDTQCPRTRLVTNLLHMPNGPINFSIHGEDIWGITCLMVI